MTRAAKPTLSPRIRRMRLPRRKPCCPICLRTTLPVSRFMRAVRSRWVPAHLPAIVRPLWRTPVPCSFSRKLPIASPLSVRWTVWSGGFVTLAGDEIGSCTTSRIARFVRLCDAFSLPVLTFVDAAGFKGIRGAAKLSQAYTEATTAKISVITGRAYGPVYIAVAGQAGRCRCGSRLAARR